MDHWAYALDNDAFQRELAPILIRALRTGSRDERQEFVQRTIAHLNDPTDGTPLNAEWHHLVQPPILDRPDLAVHRWGDVALTKDYDPAQEAGLSTAWQVAEEDLRTLGLDSIATLLGRPLGPPNNACDPRLQGAYFQSPHDVRHALPHLEQVHGALTPVCSTGTAC